jgi:hypothetical protein
MAADERAPSRESGQSLWLSDAVARFEPLVGGPIRACVVLFAVPPTAVVLAYAALRWPYFTPGYASSLSSLVAVLWAAPCLAWYYDQRLYPGFFEDCSDLLVDDAVSDRVRTRYARLYTDRWWVAALLASLPIPLLLVGGRGFVRARGLFGVSDPVFLLVALVLLWVGVLVGLGFLFVLVTLLTVRELGDAELRVDPFHPDGLGGMGAVGSFTVRTTVLFSIGALLLPLQLQYAAATGPATTALVYLMAGLYAAFIAASFIYPTLVVSRRAERVRTDALEQIRRQYVAVKRNAGEPAVGAATAGADDAVEQKLQRLRAEYRDYESVRLYPLDPSIFARLVGSVLLPLLFVVVDTLLRPQAIAALLEGLP